LEKVVEFKAMNEKEQEIWLRGLQAVTSRFIKYSKTLLLSEEVERYFIVELFEYD
jgi:hypothetical protein